MTEKNLYALTDSQAKTLRALARESATTVSNYAADALTPLDTDAAVERMAGAAFKARCGTESFTWAKAGLFRKAYLDDARTAFDALLGSEQGGTR